VAPSSPELGQLWLDTANTYGMVVKVFDGNRWARLEPGATVGTGQPNPILGDLRYDPATATFSIYQNNAWKPVNQAVELGATVPNVHQGQLWMDGNTLKVRSGSSWRTVTKENIQINVEALNVNQHYVGFSPLLAREFVKLEGSIFVDGSASSVLELIAQNPTDGWIDWGNGIVGGDVDTTAFTTDANFSPSDWYPAGKGWDQAGAELSDIPWWNGRWMEFKIELHHFTGVTILRWDIFGKDGNGNRRWTRGTVRFSRELFPIRGIGLKTINAAQSDYFMTIDGR
jgi:hypothetical protein